MIENTQSKQRAIFNIGYTCNNNCRFCAIAKTREMVTDLTTLDVKQKIEEAWQNGSTELIFSGGECSIRPDFIDLVRYARELGFKHIELTTNGRMFSYMSFAEDVVRAGLYFVRFSLHGHNKDIHDYLTRAPSSFDEIIAGIKNLVQINKNWDKYANEQIYLEITTAIVEQNYPHLVDIVKLTRKIGANQNNFNFVIPWGSAWIHRKKMIPRISDVAESIKKAIDYDRTHGRIIKKIANIPFCLLQGYEEYVSEVREGKIDIINPVGNPFDYQSHRRSKKVLFPKCKECEHFQQCEGIYTEYVTIRGSDEFIPIK